MMIKTICLVVITIFLFTNCEKEENVGNTLILNDTLSICQGDCMQTSDKKITICMDSVLNDSRCPINAFCFWEGNASARFYFEVESDKISVVLNTYHEFINDTVHNGYKLSLLWLTPYPKIGTPIYQQDYKAQIILTKE